MDLLNKLSSAIRAAANSAVHDLFGEEPPAPEDRAAALLKTARQRVARLNEQLTQAVAREKRAERAWSEGQARVSALEAEVDAAVSAGQDDVARARLAQLNQAQIKAQQLSDQWRAYASSSEKLRIEIRDLQAQLDEAEKRLQQAGEREGSAGGMEDLQRVRREQRKGASQVRDEVAAREEQVARREDNIAAREEVDKADKPGSLDQARIADLLKKRDQRNQDDSGS